MFTVGPNDPLANLDKDHREAILVCNKILANVIFAALRKYTYDYRIFMDAGVVTQDRIALGINYTWQNPKEVNCLPPKQDPFRQFAKDLSNHITEEDEIYMMTNPNGYQLFSYGIDNMAKVLIKMVKGTKLEKRCSPNLRAVIQKINEFSNAKNSDTFRSFKTAEPLPRLQ